MSSKDNKLVEEIREILFGGFEEAEKYDDTQITSTIFIDDFETLFDYLTGAIKFYIEDNYELKSENGRVIHNLRERADKLEDMYNKLKEEYIKLGNKDYVIGIDHDASYHKLEEKNKELKLEVKAHYNSCIKWIEEVQRLEDKNSRLEANLEDITFLPPEAVEQLIYSLEHPEETKKKIEKLRKECSEILSKVGIKHEQ